MDKPVDALGMARSVDETGGKPVDEVLRTDSEQSAIAAF